MTAVDRDRLVEALDAERQRFADQHPKSRALFERTGGSLMGGVPMPWMTRWASPFPIFAESAKDADQLYDAITAKAHKTPEGHRSQPARNGEGA